MKCKAIQDGFYKGDRIRQGSVFTFSGDKPGKWMQVVQKDAKPDVKKPEVSPPMALSELAKKQVSKHEKQDNDGIRG